MLHITAMYLVSQITSRKFIQKSVSMISELRKLDICREMKLKIEKNDNREKEKDIC